MFKAAASISLIAALAGCALAPDTIRVEGEHVSHLTQHFGPDRAHIGAELVGVVARWQSGGAFIDVAEAWNFSPADGHVCDGGICGCRETFTAAVGYIWRVK